MIAVKVDMCGYVVLLYALNSQFSLNTLTAEVIMAARERELSLM